MELLPLAEFAYNNAPSATTGVSPFFANKGYYPNLLIYPERDIASSRACDFVVDGEPEYEISKIVDSKIDRWRACKLLYKVIWLGYEDTDNNSEWLPATELEHAKELLNDFHLKYLSKPGPLRP